MRGVAYALAVVLLAALAAAQGDPEMERSIRMKTTRQLKEILSALDIRCHAMLPEAPCLCLSVRPPDVRTSSAVPIRKI